MENQYQKIVTIGYLAVAALATYLCMAAMVKISDAYDLEAKVKSIEFIIRGGSLLIGGGIFYLLLSNTKVNTFTNEVAVELLTKVTWPTSKETMPATGVVIVTVLLAGVVLAIFDWLWSLALRAII